jgi:hypothetical protein
MAQTYRIRPGDTLSHIALRHKTTVEALAKANGLKNPDAITAGASLIIPIGDIFEPRATEPVAPHRRPKSGTPAQPVPKPGPRPASLQPDNATLNAVPGLSARDTDALIRAVAAEARGESPAVWAAVAQTIINYSRQYGTSIARLTRTSYLSSNYDGNRVYYSMPLSRIPNLDGIRSAVRIAARGASPIGNRIHFHDNSIRTPAYGDRRSAVFIGNMIFYNPR